jgi:hypothetical protein
MNYQVLMIRKLEIDEVCEEALNKNLEEIVGFLK